MVEFDNISEELIPEILLRLPIKPLLRFKCISKSWLSFISDTHFAKSHCDLSASPTTFLLICSPPSPQCLDPSSSQYIEASLLNDDGSDVAKFHFRWFPGFAIKGSCRGFMLLDKYPFLSIWNPLTSVLKQLRYSPVPSNNTTRFVYGFGYVVSTDDYLIVLHSFIKDSTIPVIHLELYSLRTDSWKETKVPNFPYLIPNSESGLLYNGVVHRLVGVEHYDQLMTILAFGLEERSFSEVTLPSDAIRHWDSYDLMEIGGCLGLCYGVEYVEIWVMKEYKVQSSWTRCFYMDENPTVEFYPIYFTKGGEVVGLDDSTELVKLNDKGELIENGVSCEKEKIAMYTPSLLSLPPHDFCQLEEGGQQQQQT